MYLDARKGRSWRRSRKQGVSPIIATILLVAITVVLAAVLYVLISNLTHGPSNTPLGTAFSFGSQSTFVGTATTPGCAAGHFCWSIQIGSAGSGLTANGLLFKVTTGAGTGNQSKMSLVGFSDTVIATWAGTAITNSSQAVQTTSTLVLDSLLTQTSDPWSGYTLTASGQNSYSGQVTATLN